VGNSSKIGQNLTYMGLLQATNYIVPIVLMPILISRIGIEKYGTVILAQNLMIVLIGLVDFGFNLTGTRLTSQNKDDKAYLNDLFITIQSVKLYLILFSFLILIVLIHLIPQWFSLFSLMLLSFPLVIGQSILPNWFFQGKEQFKVLAILNFFSRLIYFFTVLVLVKNESHYQYINLINGVSISLSAIFANYYIIRKNEFLLFYKELDDLISLPVQNIRILLSNFSLEGYRASGVIIASFLLDSTLLGIYSIIEKVLSLINSAFVVIYNSIFPKISYLVKVEKSARSIFIKYFYTVGFLLLLGYLFGYLYWEDVVNSLTDNTDIISITQYLTQLSVLAFLIYINLPVSIILVSHDFKRTFFNYNLILFVSFVFFSIAGSFRGTRA
jgi:PST family polysaccharide transporter